MDNDNIIFLVCDKPILNNSLKEYYSNVGWRLEKMWSNLIMFVVNKKLSYVN